MFPLAASHSASPAQWVPLYSLLKPSGQAGSSLDFALRKCLEPPPLWRASSGRRALSFACGARIVAVVDLVGLGGGWGRGGGARRGGTHLGHGPPLHGLRLRLAREAKPGAEQGRQHRGRRPLPRVCEDRGREIGDPRRAHNKIVALCGLKSAQEPGQWEEGLPLRNGTGVVILVERMMPAKREGDSHFCPLLPPILNAAFSHRRPAESLNMVAASPTR